MDSSPAPRTGRPVPAGRRARSKSGRCGRPGQADGRGRACASSLAIGPVRFACIRAIRSTGCAGGSAWNWSILTRVDPQDLSCASGAELDRLDLATLDQASLVEAFTSAAGLRDDTRTARFASELLQRRPAALASLDLTSVVSPLVRLAMGRNDYKAALSWLKEARALASGEIGDDTGGLARGSLRESGPSRIGDGCL